MRITAITNQHRRDLKISLKCEMCGNEEHMVMATNIFTTFKAAIPAIKCAKCGKNAEEDS